MMASRKNNRRANLFRGHTVADIERLLKHQYCRLTTETAADYWLFAEIVRELGNRKRVAAKRLIDRVVEDYAFDGKSVEIAMVIRDNHDDLDSLAGMTAPQALSRRHDPEVKNGRDGPTRPRPSALPPKADSIPLPNTDSIPLPNTDGDGGPDGGPARNQEEIVSGGKTTNVKGLRLLSEVSPRPVEWLWENYIPLGEATIVEGHPGTNKTLLLYDIAARLTVGREMPCVPAKASRPREGGVLFLVGEDSIPKTVRSRLVAAGADLSRVGILDAVVIPDDIRTIRQAIKEIDAKLLVVDTLNDFMGCNVLGNQQVRRALRPIRELAEETNGAVVPVRHLNKSSSGSSLLRGGGSVGITAMARSQLKVCRHPDDPNLRVLIHDKCNLGPLAPSLLFEVVPVGNDACRLEWHGECSLTVDDLDRKGKGTPTLEAAEKFLLDKLAAGPQEINRLVEQAKGVCSKRMLDEAKKSLSIKTIRKGKGRNHKVYWSL